MKVTPVIQGNRQGKSLPAVIMAPITAMMKPLSISHDRKGLDREGSFILPSTTAMIQLRRVDP